MPTTWNPSDTSTNVTLSGGNLTAASTGANVGTRAADAVSTGQYYWEYTLTTWTGAATNGVGFALGTASLTGGVSAGVGVCGIAQGGAIYVNGVSTGVGIGATSNGSVICVALDMTRGYVWARLGAAGNWNGNASYSPGGSGGIALPWSNGSMNIRPYAFMGATGQSVTANFTGSFVGAVPSGFSSGFPSGLTPPLQAEATQIALEQWAQGTPRAQLTQVAVEHWAAVGTTPPQVVMTQMALEQWASVMASAGQQARAMILA